MSILSVIRSAALATAIAVAFPALASAQSSSVPAIASSASQHMVCVKNFLGCKTTYKGPVDQAAARAYHDDATAAMKLIVEKFDTVQSAHYTPKRRMLVIEALPGKRVDNFQQLDIENIMLHAHLALDEIRFMSAGHRRLANGRRVIRDYGGSSRYFALRQVNFEADISAPTGPQMQMARAHRPGTPLTDAFGNIFVSMR